MRSNGAFSRMKKWEGLRFGKLTVLTVNRIDRYLQDNGKYQNIKYFNCQCDCGNIAVVRQASLNTTKSCGCARTEENKSRSADISGEKFNRLTAISKEGKDWKCICECGAIVYTSVTKLRNNNTKSCGCLQREHAKASMTAMLSEKRISLGKDPDQPLSSDRQLLRSEFSFLAKEILKRDNYSCIWCSVTGKRLNIHHLVPWSVSEELRFDKQNLVALCEDCHKTVHNNNYHLQPNLHMTILLQGYTKLIEEEAIAAREPRTPN